MPSAPQRRATYRLQLRPDFGFDQAAGVLPYLRDLGVSHVYCSPYFEAARGSTHGYDVVDPGRISDELGGVEAHARFCARLSELGLRHLLDIVPNHMCVTDRGNWRWWDVLKRGRQSPWAESFDIDWEVSERVLVPVLGDTLERLVERGEIGLERNAAELVVRHLDHVAPIGPGSDSALDLERVNSSAAALLALLERQHYRLAHWREAAGHINYRRFFDINSLAGVRVEEPRVFAGTQALAIDLVQSGVADGLRVDHVDGLRLPSDYLAELRGRIGEQPWLVVEKILDRGESLPDGWAAGGTTGYEFAAVAGGLFVDPAGRAPLDALTAEVAGAARNPREVIAESRQLVCERSFGADIARLARHLLAACRARPEHVERGLDECAAAATALLVGMPVYRTYATGHGEPLSQSDRAALDAALEHARTSHPEVAPELLELIASLVDGAATTVSEIDFVLRLQQTSAAVAAKGVEDTAFYRCVSLVSLDEVGDSPVHWGTSPVAFHRHNQEVAAASPLTLLATSTHDTKRSEDVRMRLHLLSEFPRLWAERVRRWSARNARHKVDGNPDATDELLLYQMIVGAHPLSAARAAAYMEKATREAKRHTSWTDPDPVYDQAVQAFTRRVVDDDHFAAELQQFVMPLLGMGRVNSLALTLLKLTSPGVPDIYQGCELWDLSLVDPDNRRAVDFDLRRAILARAAAGGALPAPTGGSGESKLELIRRTLELRRRRASSFGPQGDYRHVAATGERAEHIVAFQRGGDVITVVPRLVGRINGWSAAYEPVWNDTSLMLPDGRWHDVLSAQMYSGHVRVSHLLAAFPVALLERTG